MEKPNENSTLFSIISRSLRDTVLYKRKKLMFTKDIMDMADINFFLNCQEINYLLENCTIHVYEWINDKLMMKHFLSDSTKILLEIAKKKSMTYV